MDTLKVAKFMENKKELLFPNEKYSEIDIDTALMVAPDSLYESISRIPFKSPGAVQVIAVFPGQLGVDRFYLGDIKGGILKYFTFGGFLVWWLKDIFSAKKRCRDYNCRKLMETLNDPSIVDDMKRKQQALKDVASVAKKVAPVVKDIAKDSKQITDTFYVK